MRFAIHLRLIIVFCLASGQLAVGEPQKSAKKESPKSPARTSAVRLFNPDMMAKPVSTYSHVAEIIGVPSGTKLIFIAGQVGNDASGQLVSTTDFRAQVEQAFKNIKAAVEAAGGTMSDIVKTNYYCTESVESSQMSGLREIRDRYIDTAHPPTSTFVIVKRLARPEYLIEIEAVAAISK